MITVQILEPNDEVLSTDWCRPLLLCTMSGGQSDEYSFTSAFDGTPENNVKWVNVSQVFGEFFYGKEVKFFNSKMECKYEFMRGEPPMWHKYGPTNRDINDAYTQYLMIDKSRVGKFKGESWYNIAEKDPRYFDWCVQNGFVMTAQKYHTKTHYSWHDECEKQYKTQSER